MIELTYEIVLGVGGIFTTSIVSVGIYMIRSLSNLCSRVSNLEGRHLEIDSTKGDVKIEK